MNSSKFNNIPADLKTFPNWIMWRRIERKGKTAKAPYTVNGTFAGVNNPNTWTTFEKAVEAFQSGKYDGIGFVFTDTPYVGIDIDKCVVDGELTPIAKDVIKRLNSYTEFSPSGNGLHIIVNRNSDK